MLYFINAHTVIDIVAGKQFYISILFYFLYGFSSSAFYNLTLNHLTLILFSYHAKSSNGFHKADNDSYDDPAIEMHECTREYKYIY